MLHSEGSKLERRQQTDIYLGSQDINDLWGNNYIIISLLD